MTEDIATGMLALRPRHCFDFDAAGGAIHPAHGVGERDRDVPDRDELKLSRLSHAVVSGTRFATPGALGFAIGPRDDFGNDAH